MVTSVLVLDPAKLISARGQRTLREIADATGGKLSAQQLSAYEHGRYRPKPESLATLLAALGVDFETVARPVVPANGKSK